MALVGLSWYLNWTLPGLRTHWAFFPLWLGYSLAIDGLVAARTGTSLLTRSVVRYVGLFVVSAPAWWLFEAINLRTANWVYIGADAFPPAAYAFWTTINFSTVLPAVFGSAELMASFGILARLPRGPRLSPTPRVTIVFFLVGWISLALLLVWPHLFFPFAWLALYFIIEPVNVWRGNRNLARWTQDGDWRPVLALWLGVLLTAFFWEMWNFWSFPKWIYQIPWGDGLRVFEMPLLGFGGYLPFSLELYALYHLVVGLVGSKADEYIHLGTSN